MQTSHVLPPIAKFSPRLLTYRVTKTVANTWLVSLLSLSVLAGCTPASKPQPTSQTDSGENDATPANPNPTRDNKVLIYASTNVWGAVAQAVGGDNVRVIAGVNTPTQDPHNYQATATNKLTVSKAKLVLVNGGGYDDWATSLAASVAASPQRAGQPVVINAVTISGYDATKTGKKAEFNEHVFYSLATANKVAQAVATQLSQTDPSHKTQYSQNLQAFSQDISRLKTKAQATATQKTAFFTEPVAGYLLADMGIKSITPADFIKQAETDAGVSAKLLQDSNALLSNHHASVLVLNAQTEDATAKALLATAQAAQVPVVNVYETLPANLLNQDNRAVPNAYSQFIEATIDNLQKAVGTQAGIKAGTPSVLPPP